MTTQPEVSSFVEVDLKAEYNNANHHTDEVSTVKLIPRRGQGFSISLKFKDSYNPEDDPLIFTATTGERPDESKGTKVIFGVPDFVDRSAEAKVVWKAEIDQKESSPETGHMVIIITPSADALIGKYTLYFKRSQLNRQLGTLSLLFNPWCPDDSVYMEDEEERQEYVMNEHGVIFTGSSDYIFPLHWDYGQFEYDMVELCLLVLNMKPKDYKDLAGDESSLNDPIYVGRVVSAMINSVGDMGVLQGRWNGNYEDGVSPSRWSGSYPILKRWYNSGCRAVKYGQCWVFAGVMCSVMRLLGIPCRVISNFDSAHDTNRNLVIDMYYADYGVMNVPSGDSVWNFHVWVEAWMKRPDLPGDLGGWQVLDPTPQELSEGVFCCGPASVTAVRLGLTSRDYDVPFVFAEVNADSVAWLVKADGSKIKIFTDTESVGQKISTKSLDSDLRLDITNKYKYREGTEAERSVYKFAVFLNDLGVRRKVETREVETREVETREVETPEVVTLSSNDTMDGLAATTMITVERVEETLTMPKVLMRFEEVSKLVNGQDVKLNLVLNSESTEPRPLSINLGVTAQSYNGSARSEILSERKEDTLLPGKDLRVPVVVPFSKYQKPMLNFDVMKVSAIVTDTRDDSQVYLAKKNVILVNPPIEVKAFNDAQVDEQLFVEMLFTNPVGETLKNCTLTLSGSGLLREEQDISLPNLAPKRRVRVKVYFYPYKAKQKTLTVDFNCSVFRDIKATLPVYVNAKTQTQTKTKTKTK